MEGGIKLLLYLIVVIEVGEYNEYKEAESISTLLSCEKERECRGDDLMYVCYTSLLDFISA